MGISSAPIVHEFSGGKCLERMKYVFAVNCVKKPLAVCFEDKDAWEHPIFAVRGDRVKRSMTRQEMPSLPFILLKAKTAYAEPRSLPSTTRATNAASTHANRHGNSCQNSPDKKNPKKASSAFFGFPLFLYAPQRLSVIGYQGHRSDTALRIYISLPIFFEKGQRYFVSFARGVCLRQRF